MEMTIDTVGINWSHDGCFLLLAGIDKERLLPIYIGRHEAEAVVHGLSGIKYPRPFTHDLLTNAITEIGGTLDHIEINSMSGKTYIGTLVVKRNGTTHEIDARPSDAIATATREKCPIQVADTVLERAGYTPATNTDTSVVSILWPFARNHHVE